jgi:hypothetical protein
VSGELREGGGRVDVLEHRRVEGDLANVGAAGEEATGAAIAREGREFRRKEAPVEQDRIAALAGMDGHHGGRGRAGLRESLYQGLEVMGPDARHVGQ